MPEVAAAMGIPFGTAQSRLHYALVAMRATVVPAIRLARP